VQNALASSPAARLLRLHKPPRRHPSEDDRLVPLPFTLQAPLSRVRRDVTALLDAALAYQLYVIVRPLGDRVTFVKLDDLDAAGLERVKPAAFLGLRASPGAYQAWVALAAADASEAFGRWLRTGAGADPGACGATRIAGHPNFSQETDAPHFATVAMAHSAPGCIATLAQLAALGLVAPTGGVLLPPRFAFRASGGPTRSRDRATRRARR
jgi:hypothetical protein